MGNSRNRTFQCQLLDYRHGQKVHHTRAAALAGVHSCANCCTRSDVHTLTSIMCTAQYSPREKNTASQTGVCDPPGTDFFFLKVSAAAWELRRQLAALGETPYLCDGPRNSDAPLLQKTPGKRSEAHRLKRSGEQPRTRTAIGVLNRLLRRACTFTLKTIPQQLL